MTKEVVVIPEAWRPFGSDRLIVFPRKYVGPAKVYTFADGSVDVKSQGGMTVVKAPLVRRLLWHCVVGPVVRAAALPIIAKLRLSWALSRYARP